VKVIIFGASGTTGRILVGRALEEGHEVTAFVRDPTRATFPRGGVRIAQGDVLDAVSVDRAIAGQEAVLSALGNDARRPPPVLSQGIVHILDAMERHGAKRIVVLTAAGALRERAGFLGGTAGLRLARRMMSGLYEEHRKMLEELRRRDLDWVAVRAVILTNRPARGHYRVVLEGIPRWGAFISRADVAGFMLRQLTSNEFVRKMPAIGN
jgi:putative NADH-flavin reductase